MEKFCKWIANRYLVISLITNFCILINIVAIIGGDLSYLRLLAFGLCVLYDILVLTQYIIEKH